MADAKNGVRHTADTVSLLQSSCEGDEMAEMRKSGGVFRVLAVVDLGLLCWIGTAWYRQRDTAAVVLGSVKTVSADIMRSVIRLRSAGWDQVWAAGATVPHS